MAFAEEEKKNMFFILWTTHDKLCCEECNDIDCSLSSTYKLLEKKHKIDVIDKKSCKKQMRERRIKLMKILKNPYFKKERERACDHCGKKYDMFRDKRVTMTLPIVGSENYRMIQVCKGCAKKLKDIKIWWRKKNED